MTRKIYRNLAIPVLGFAGLGIYYLAHTIDVESLNTKLTWLPTVLTALGEGVLVAAILALLVDYRLKREIADETSATLFRKFVGGDRAPDEYVSAFLERSKAPAIAYQAKWNLHLSWADTDTLEIVGAIELETKNISGRPLSREGIWLREATRPGYRAKFLSYRQKVSVDPTSKYGLPNSTEYRLDESELASCTSIQGSGIAVDLEVAPSSEKIPVDALCTTQWEGRTFFEATDFLPLALRQPAIFREIALTGPAIDDLSFSIHGGSGSNFSSEFSRQKADSKLHRVLRFSVRELSLSGPILVVSWRRKVSPPVQEGG